MKKKYDLVSVGDCTIDAFIKLHDASVHCDLNGERCQICMSFADKVPYESLTVIAGVGNAANVAVGASRLVWGSDVTMETGLAKLWALEHTGLSPDELHLIRWKNALRIFPPGSFPSLDQRCTSDSP